MPRLREVLGRDGVIRQTRELLAGGRSVLLFGPEAIGKTAIVAAVACDGMIVVDPLERITRQTACDMRRALDRGVVYLAASRVCRGRPLGTMGRILWRFALVHVRELPDDVLRRIVMREVGGACDTSTAWVRELVVLSRGRPGFASEMVRFSNEWYGTHGSLPLPAMAFAMTREAAAIRTLREAPGRRSDRAVRPEL